MGMSRDALTPCQLSGPVSTQFPSKEWPQPRQKPFSTGQSPDRPGRRDPAPTLHRTGSGSGGSPRVSTPGPQARPRAPRAGRPAGWAQAGRGEGRGKAVSRAPVTCWWQRTLQRTTCLPPRQKPSTPCSAGGETEAWEVTWPRRSWAVMEKVGGEGRGPGRSLGPWGGGALP